MDDFAPDDFEADDFVPDSDSQEVIQEQGVSLGERAAIKNFGPGGIAAAREWLEREPGQGGKPTEFMGVIPYLTPGEKLRQYETREYKPGEIAVRPKGERGPYRPVDPDTGMFSKDILGDISDLGMDIAMTLVPGRSAKAVGASMGLAELGRRGIGQLYGFQDTAGDALKGAAVAGVAGAAGTKLLQGFGAMQKLSKQRALEKYGTSNPLKVPYVATVRRAAENKATLERISGRAGQIEAAEAARAAEKVGKNQKRQKVLQEVMEAQKKREAEREARDMAARAKKARSTEEAASAGGQSFNAAEHMKEAARLRKEAVKLDKDDPARETLLSRASAEVEKAREIRSRLGAFRQTIRQRTAREAADEAGGATVTPGAPAGAGSVAGRAIDETDLNQIRADAETQTKDIWDNFFFEKEANNKLAFGKVISHDIRAQKNREAYDWAIGRAKEIREDAHRKAMKVLMGKGMSHEAAAKSAREALKEAGILSLADAPPLSARGTRAGLTETLSDLIAARSTEDVAERAATEAASRTASQIRANIEIGPSTIWRVTGEAALGKVALLGHKLENAPHRIAQLARDPRTPAALRGALRGAAEAWRTGGQGAYRRALKRLLTISAVRQFLEETEAEPAAAGS